MSDVIRKYQGEILADWCKEMPNSIRRSDLISETEFRNQATQFLKTLAEGSRDSEKAGDLSTPEGSAMRDLLDEISRARVQLGFTPSQIATFVFSVKPAIFSHLRTELNSNPQLLADEVYRV